jgi:GntR family transcriptional regulator
MQGQQSRPVQILHLHEPIRRSERARHIRDLLRNEIRSGVHGRGLLPTEAELALRFGSTRNALRDALDLLRTEGLIERVPGAGTFVLKANVVQHIDRLEGLAESQENGHRRVSVKVLDAGLLVASDAVASRLEVPTGSDVLFLERRLCLDNEPVSVWSSYLPADLADGLVAADLSLDFYELLEHRLGVKVGTAEWVTAATLADESVAEILEVQPGAAVLLIERLMRHVSGRPLEFGFVYLRGDSMQFATLLTRSGPGPDRD